jgi:hypothetical protein
MLRNVRTALQPSLLQPILQHRLLGNTSQRIWLSSIQVHRSRGSQAVLLHLILQHAAHPAAPAVKVHSVRITERARRSMLLCCEQGCTYAECRVGLFCCALLTLQLRSQRSPHCHSRWARGTRAAGSRHHRHHPPCRRQHKNTTECGHQHHHMSKARTSTQKVQPAEAYTRAGSSAAFCHGNLLQAWICVHQRTTISAEHSPC